MWIVLFYRPQERDSKKDKENHSVGFITWAQVVNYRRKIFQKIPDGNIPKNPSSNNPK